MLRAEATAGAASSENGFERRLELAKLAALAELAAGAGHEINNPLSVIVGRAQLLLRGEANPDRRRDLAIIAAQAMRVHEMIADLMLFARPPQPRPAACDLVALASQVVRELKGRAELQQTCLELAEASSAVVASVDAAQIAGAIRALIENALEALGSGGRVDVSVDTIQRDDAPSARIVVRDNGPGIPEQVRDHLFDPFYSGRQAGRGLGLGLSKCWRIVTQHGGAIDVANSDAGGARFTILLPCGAA